MGRNIMKTAVQGNEMTPGPQMLRSSERGQLYAAPTSISNTFQLVTYDTMCSVTEPTRDVARGIPDQLPQHVSQAVSSADTLRRSHEFDAATSFPQENVFSQVPLGHIRGTTSDIGTRIPSSNSTTETAIADQNEPGETRDDAKDSDFEVEEAQILSSARISIETDIVPVKTETLSRTNYSTNSDKSSQSPLPVQSLPAGSGSLGLVNVASPRTPSVASQTISVQEQSHSWSSRSRDTEAISPAPSVASTSTERPILLAGVQLDDHAIYSIGPIKIFSKIQRAIGNPYEARWEIIYPEIFDRVLLRLRRRRFGVKPNMPRALPNIQLMSAGTTRDTSIPAVVVMIPKHINMMQSFLDTDSIVQNLCKPRDGVTVELQILACKDRATLIGRLGETLHTDTILSSDFDSDYLSENEAWITSSDDSDSENCAVVNSMTSAPELSADFMQVLFEERNSIGDVKSGLAIRLVTKDGLRCVRGTCGGIFQLEKPYHPPRRVGLVAGHLLEQLSETSNDGVQEVYEARSIIGDMLYPRTSRDIPRHDWALFDAAKLGFEDALIRQHTLAIAKVSELPKEDTAVNIRTLRGAVSGTLTSSTSGILLNPDQGFLHVRLIIMDRGSSPPNLSFISSPRRIYGGRSAGQANTDIWTDSFITKGDSGAWVVQEGFGKIYGLVIATNSNGDAYMVPLNGVISEMEGILDVSNVSMATSPDPSYENHPTIADEHLQQTVGPMPLSGAQENTSPSDNNNHANRMNELADRCLESGEVEMAIELLEEAVSTQEQLSQGDSGRLASKHELGRAYAKDGRFLEAIKILEEVTKVRGEVLDQYHPDFLASQQELAFAHMQSGQPSEAIKILENVVTTEGAIFEQANMELLTSQHELARAYLADDKASEAATLIKHVVTVKKSTLVESHPKLLRSQIVLAEAHLMKGHILDALRLLEHVVAVADASCSEHDELRIMAGEWLEFARQKALGSGPSAVMPTSQ